MLFSLLLASMTARAFDYADLRQLINDRDLRSVEETLPLLPEGLRSNVVLMRESRSLQAASETQPRAILFNDDASLVVSFTKERRGGDRFEIMTFANDRFDVKTIQFIPGERALIDEKPRNCFGCHGRMENDLRPAWDPGLVWRGAFGEQDDLITDLESEAYEKIAGPSYASLNLSRSDDRTLVENRPNLRLGLLLMRQQVQRVIRLAGPSLLKRLCAGPAKPLDIVPNLTRFLPSIYGDEFTRDFISREAPSLSQTLAVLAEAGVDPDEIPLTIERRTNAVFDGSFPFRQILFGELAKRAGVNVAFSSLTASPLGLRTSPALDAIDRVGMALDEASIAALCQM